MNTSVRPDASAEMMVPPQWLMTAAIARIQDGVLPRALLNRILAGPGRGQICALCDHAIEPGDVGYQAAPANGGGTLDFHAACYRAWVKACETSLR